MNEEDEGTVNIETIYEAWKAKREREIVDNLRENKKRDEELLEALRSFRRNDLQE